MKRALLLLAPAMMWAQNGPDLLTRGADIFARSCSTGYCHGLKGTAGGAPRLAARGFDEAFIMSVTRAGVLFFDSVRGFARCATCHQVDGLGIPVTSPMTKVPAGVPALRDLATPAIKTATADGETFPAL